MAEDKGTQRKPVPKHAGLKALGPNADPQLIPQGIPQEKKSEALGLQYQEDFSSLERLKPEEISEDTLEKVTATKLYIHSFYDNLVQSINQRVQRKRELETAMENYEINEDQQKALWDVYQEKETEYMRLKRKKISINDFETLKVIGRGSFGEVRLVKHKESNEIFALKKMRKLDMIEQKQIANVRAERDLMSASSDNEWLVALYYSFQDAENIYLIMEYYPGGDLWNLLQTVQLTEDEVRFYIAEIILSINSIHKLGFFHRDLKPENILFDRGGHVKLADFGLCKPVNVAHKALLDELMKKGKKEIDKQIQATAEKTKRQSTKFKADTWKKKRREFAFSVVGTPGYAAPEVMYETGYSYECDWWSLGIMMFEMVYGYHPFHADSVEELCMNVLQWRSTLKFPKDVQISDNAMDLMTRLICDDKDRIGRKKGFQEFKEHPFFEGVVWEELREIEPPFVPEVNSITDTTYFEDYDELAKDEGTDIEPQSKLTKTNLPFVGFTFKRFEAVIDKDQRIAEEKMQDEDA